MNKTKYWYKTTVYYCPVCGRETRYKERQYSSPKPKVTMITKDMYDWCDVI